MQPIHPISAKSCKHLLGKPVFLVLKDGSRLFGVLHRVDNNRLTIGEETLASVSAKPKKTAKKTTATKSKPAKTARKQTPAEQSAPEQETPAGLISFGFWGPPPEAPAPRSWDVPLDNVGAMFTETV
ncbi:hypothetical protein ABE504_27905 [Paenibacillus oryzisoli]|uniref:hypothetical protein n=1 Tax=Paenibacillus oryzisoli TaxID=1850517 RepID=UPI003D291543